MTSDISNKVVGQTSGQCVKPKNTRNGTSLHVLVADRLAVLILKVKRAADGGNRRSDRRRRASADVDDGAEHQHQPAQEGAEHRQNAEGPSLRVQIFLLRQPKQATKPARMVSKNTVAP